MSRPIRVIVLNTDAEAAPELRTLLLGISGVKIVAEVDEPVLLTQALAQFPAEVLLLHLDPNPAAIMEVAAPLISERKDQIACVAMTDNRDAELVMRAMRAGMREFLWKPFPPDQLCETLRRVGQEARVGGRRAGRLIPVVGCCGGVGATTIATNVAVELAQLPWADGALATGAAGQGIESKPKVALVDLDLRFGQVAMFLDIQPTYTIAELCDTPEHIEPQMIERVLVKHSTGVHVLAQPADLEQSERISAAQCAGVLATLMEHYDLVVVDGPVRMDPSARAVFDMTDVYLVVLQLLVPPVRNADRLLQDMQRSGYNLDKIRLVNNRAGRESNYLDPSDVQDTLHRPISWSLPDDWKLASTSINIGAPLLLHAPKSKLRACFQQMANDLAQPISELTRSAPPATKSEDSPKKKLLSIFGGQKS